MPHATGTSEVRIVTPELALGATLSIPLDPAGVVLFAHGSGSSRFSPRNRFVAGVLREAGLATVLLDRLTPAGEAVDAGGGHLRFDVAPAGAATGGATDWLRDAPATHPLAIGYFGARTGAGAALAAAATRPDHVRAVVSRGGRPDLAGAALERVRRVHGQAAHRARRPRSGARSRGMTRGSARKEGPMDANRLHTGGIPDPESGEPGGGRGRRDEVGGSGVYPASAGNAPADAVPRTQAEWGQGERGAAGYDDSGSSGLFYYPAQIEAAEPSTPPTPAASAETADGVPAEDERVAERRRMEWGAW